MTCPDTLALERAFSAAWPALETLEDGNWVAGFSRGYTRRANSIQSFAPTDDVAPERRLDALVAAYDARGIEPCFRVTPLAGTATFEALCAAGWRAFGQSLVLDRPIGLTSGPDGDALIHAPDDAGFLAIQARLKGLDDAGSANLKAIVDRVQLPAAGLVLQGADGAPAASMLCIVSDGIGVLLNVVTDPAQRRQGLAGRLLATALSWFDENGASHAALQVEADNVAAIALYLRAGFAYRYPYHYRLPAQGSA